MMDWQSELPISLSLSHRMQLAKTGAILAEGTPSAQYIPLPFVDALLPENVQLIKAAVDSMLYKPPPRMAEFAEKMQFVIVTDGVDGMVDRE